jgi:hypothetical protein
MEMNGVTPASARRFESDDKSCRARFNAFWADLMGQGTTANNCAPNPDLALLRSRWPTPL